MKTVPKYLPDSDRPDFERWRFRLNALVTYYTGKDIPAEWPLEKWHARHIAPRWIIDQYTHWLHPWP